VKDKVTLAIKLGNSTFVKDDAEALDTFNKFFFLQFYGSGYKWHEIDAMPDIEMQLMIMCMNAYNQAQAIGNEKGRIYSQLGIVKAGKNL
jgi:hypothetical protein